MSQKVSSPEKEPNLHLPVSRVKIIMKSSPDIEQINTQSLALITKAAELFIRDLSLRSYDRAKSSGKKEIDYKQIAEVVDENDNLSFLSEMVPRKITMAQYLRIMEGKGIPIVYDKKSSEEENSDT